MGKQVEGHGDWLVWHDPLPTEWRGGDWHYVRKDAADSFDVGHEESREMALQTIDWLDEQKAADESPEGQARLQKSAERMKNKLHDVMLIRSLGDALEAAHSILAANGRGFLDLTHRQTFEAGLAEYREWAA